MKGRKFGDVKEVLRNSVICVCTRAGEVVARDNVGCWSDRKPVVAEQIQELCVHTTEGRREVRINMQHEERLSVLFGARQSPAGFLWRDSKRTIAGV